jgi:hypothetical protein
MDLYFKREDGGKVKLQTPIEDRRITCVVLCQTLFFRDML